uniref:Cytochrome P450 CYP79D73 n=1 Tax=Plumeria rubra TaxID=62097 RepID=A0A3Q9NNX0_PLURU|nr:cytochrome P450 CYP79D73 [Plumeria rubra]
MTILLLSPSFLFLLSAFLQACILSYYIKCRRSESLPLPPGPKPWPMVGCTFQMVRNRPTFRWIHKIMHKMNTEIACVRIANIHVISVASPELSREFLKKQDTNFSSRPLCLSADLTSNGYLTTILVPIGNQYNKMKRILVSEVLTVARHKWLHDKRDEEADHLVLYIYNQCKYSVERGLVNVRTAARHYCGNLIRKLIFNKRFFGRGTENGGPGAEEEVHVDALFTILAHLYAFGVSDYMPWLKMFDIGGHRKILKEALGKVKKYHDPEIDERIQMWKKGSKIEQEDLLDVLITLKDDNGSALLTTEEIKAQITELMIAAVDNPSNAAEWALAEMLNQPETLEKAVNELDIVVGKNRLVQESDIPRLNYIKACAKESFRLHPIAPFNVPHVAIKDTTVAGYFIPKGSHVLLSRPGLGRNPRIWKEPLKFKPERHLKDDGSEVVLVDHELRMLSFSTGRRGCPGVLLGSTMTTMLLARILQGFTWNIPSGNGSKIDLAESESDLLLAKPLVAMAKPRLAENVYPAI